MLKKYRKKGSNFIVIREMQIKQPRALGWLKWMKGIRSTK